MKSLLLFCAAIAAAAFPVLLSGQTADTFQLSGCARFWANDHPVDHVRMSVQMDYAGQSSATFYGPENPDTACSTVAAVLAPSASFTGFWIYGEYQDTVNDYRNGVSIADLICISKHILGLDPLSPPAQIAADANKSGSVTTFDLKELQKLILGVYTNLPNSSSWQIWSSNCTFPNPANPFQINCTPFPADSLSHFEQTPARLTSLKIGDVDGDYAFDGNYQPSYSAGPQHLFLPDVDFISGDTILVPLYWENPSFAEGIQFALRYDTAVLKIIDLIPGMGISADSWAIFSSEGIISNSSVLFNTTVSDTLGYLRFFVKSNGHISGSIQLDSAILHPIFSFSCGLMGKITLGYDPVSGVSHPSPLSWVGAATPNPYPDQTYIPLALERPSAVRLEILDLTGRRTYMAESDLPAGVHRLQIPAGALSPGSAGMYRVTAGKALATGKLIRL